MSKSSKQTETAEATDKQVESGRRHALKKLGKYSAYTAPVLLTLLMPKKGRAGVMSPPPM